MPGLILGGLNLLNIMVQAVLNVTEVLKVGECFDKKVFNNSLSLEYENRMVLISSLSFMDNITPNDGFCIYLNKVECRILSDILLQMSKSI